MTSDNSFYWNETEHVHNMSAFPDCTYVVAGFEIFKRRILSDAKY
jgi:hypothetical protein